MDRFDYLFGLYVAKTASESERSQFLDMVQEGQHDQRLKELIDEYLINGDFQGENALLGSGKDILRMVFDSVEVEVIAPKPASRRLWRKFAYVAAALSSVVFGIWFYTSRFHRVIPSSPVSAAKMISTGTRSATLTLASGRKIVLSEAGNGKLAEEAGVIITKRTDGVVVYQIRDVSGESSKTNTLTTARGETFQLHLPDHTLVWLNSQSSLTFPVSFQGLKHRRVELSGEGYFQVAKDKRHPFIVNTPDQQVEVLGTHFNLTAYPGDANTSTTLLEGSVRVVSRRGASVIIKPGQQTSLSNAGLKVNDVEVSDVIAWKNGFFTFNNENLGSIMTKVARWYNITVEYRDPSAKEIVLYGSFSKFENFATVVKTLERTKLVNIRIQGSRVTIAKKN